MNSDKSDVVARAKSLESLFEAMPEGIVVQDLSGRIVEFNRSALQITGLTAEYFKQLPPPGTNAAGGAAYLDFFKPARQALQSGQTRTNPRARLTGADGLVRYFSIVANPIQLDGETNFTHVLSTFRDVTNEQRVLKARELGRTLDTQPSPVAYFDRSQTILYANSLYSGFYGLTPDSIKGQTLLEVWQGEYYDAIKSEVDLALAGLERTFERAVTDQDGAEHRVIISYVPDRIDGDIEGVYIYVTDNSLLRKLQNERRGYETHLIASSKMSMLGEMAAGLAHEINNPLAIINGTAAVLHAALKNKRLTDEVLETGLVKIDATVQRIAKIIRGLRTFARDTGEDPKMNTPLASVVSDTLDLCRERVRNRGITLKAALPANAHLRCNAAQVSQILINLISNAVDAVEAGGEKWIEVSADVSDGRVKIFVTDGGLEIPREVTERMMNPFFTTKPVGKGSGLGLSISKGLAESNGGTLDYVPNTKNTCFVLDLPAPVIKPAKSNGVLSAGESSVR